MFEDDGFDLDDALEPAGQADSQELAATKMLGHLFNQNRDRVFFSRQLEVQHEDNYFHWITNRALHNLREEGVIRSEAHSLRTAGEIKLLWHHSNRYYRRSAARLLSLVQEYADPNIAAVIGLHGEFMVLEAFARCEFVMRGRNTRKFGSKVWQETDHNLDFIFEKDGQGYGVEVKNTLGYMQYEEFQVKLRMCQFLGIRPIFAVRMLPKTWIFELAASGGYAMILKYQLYPWAHKSLARRVADELGLPVDAPRSLYEATTDRLLKWHRKAIL